MPVGQPTSGPTLYDGRMMDTVSLVRHSSSPGQMPRGSSPHACRHCNARFTRREHLKRHLASLHGGRDSKLDHGCKFCGKSFSRKDVLLRHQQSCQAASEAGSSSTTKRKPRRIDRACQTCRDLKVKCSGGMQCEKCADLGHNCVYGDNRSAAASSSTTCRVPLVSDPSGTHALTSLDPFPQPDQLDESLTPRSDDCYFSWESQNNPRHVDEQVIIDHDVAGDGLHEVLQQEASLRSNASNYGTAEGLTAPQHEPQTDEISCPKERRPAKKRGRYVSNACLSCQKRKVKCSGDVPCVQCRHMELRCVYDHHGRKKRGSTNSKRGKQTSPAPTHQESSLTLQSTTETVLEDQDRLTESLSQIMGRIACLERDSEAFKNHVLSVSAGGQNNDSRDFSPSMDVDDSSENGASSDDLIASEMIYGSSSLLALIDILDRDIASKDIEQCPQSSSSSRSVGESEGSENSSGITLKTPPRSGIKSIKMLERETMSKDIDLLRRSIDIFFADIHPLYATLDENIFRAQFEQLLVGDGETINSADRYQMFALVNLIHAEVQALAEESTDSMTMASHLNYRHVPGWNDFCLAENILNYLVWLGNGNILTIQCLLVKARYLMVIGKADSSYDTIGRAVRLCFQLGLHNQALWTSCSPYEVVTRQRIFWTTYCLEHIIALNTGAPYVIRESDFKVDLQRHSGDSETFTDQLPRQEISDSSYLSYLNGSVKWTRLCAETWDATFGINAQRDECEEFVASMDARILYMASQLPEPLQWRQEQLSNQENTTMLRLALSTHLRLNHLRLLLRQKSVFGDNFNNAVAKDCVPIAKSSITAINAFYTSPIYMPTYRFTSIHYLVGCLLPLVSIIINSFNVPDTQTEAIETFTVGISVLHQMALHCSAARSALQRLHRIFETARQAVQKLVDMHLLVLDPKGIEILEINQQITDIFSQDHYETNHMVDDAHLVDACRPPMYDSSGTMNLEFPTSMDAINVFQVEGDTMNSQLMIY